MATQDEALQQEIYNALYMATQGAKAELIACDTVTVEELEKAISPSQPFVKALEKEILTDPAKLAAALEDYRATMNQPRDAAGNRIPSPLPKRQWWVCPAR